jgi:hypothetical protein
VADSVRVDTEAVRAAGQQAQAAGGVATPGSDQVQPSAPDMVSVGASTRFGAQVSLARRYTALANTQARLFGVKLDASAGAYDEQEAHSAATLGTTGGPAGAVPVMPAAAVVPADLLSGGVPAGVPAGEVPASPRDVARLIESGRGGAGKRTWEVVAASLRSEATALDEAADQLGQAINTTGDGWQAQSAEAARTQMRALQSWYQGHARYVQGLAEQAHAHVQNFSKALTDVPPYRQVLDAERELRSAMQFNARSGGTARAAVVQAQVKVSKLYQASMTGFGSYTVAEAMPEPKMPVPPPVYQASPDAAPAVPPAAPGDGPARPAQSLHSPTGAPGDPVQAGPGVGQDLTGGPTWPPGAVDPAGPGAPLSDAVPQSAGEMPAQVVPGIIGGVVGGLGGLLGGLAAAPQKALQGLQQAAGPMMSGLGQHPGGGEPQHGGELSPPSSEPPGGADLPSPGDVGAGSGGGGDTEPAGGGGEGPLAAPTGVAGAPAAAAPTTAPMPAPAPAEAPAPAMGAMGPMMPPMRGTGEGSGPDNKQLYQERKLKVVAPPNSEPVKNRREGRPKPPGRKKP